MKNINEILILIKKEFIKTEYITHDDAYACLCDAVTILVKEFILTNEDGETFLDYLELNKTKYAKANWNGRYLTFYFPIKNRPQRLIYLNKHIKLTKK